uniref:Uncharacterized protein n=1 Tax=Caenorhabditis japonica TaxID=281687 RepID=A0A8R1E5E3_CAEJA
MRLGFENPKCFNSVTTAFPHICVSSGAHFHDVLFNTPCAWDIQEYKTIISCLKSSTSGTGITSRTAMEKEIQQFYSKLF